LETVKVSLLALCLSLTLVQGCATARKISPSVDPGSGKSSLPTLPEIMGPPELYGPPAPVSPIPLPLTPAMTYGPEPVQLWPVVLVFGPGLARGYSYVGVLRAFKEQKIPIGAIFGTEMGGLIAALYGMSSNLNQFEWGLLKLMSNDNFLAQKGLFSRNTSGQPTDGKKLEKTLRQMFGEKDLREAKIPIRIAIQAKATGLPIVLDHGNVAQAVRAALAVPSLFEAGTWGAQSGDIAVVSAASSRPYLVNEARSLGLGPIVVIDVAAENEGASVQAELASADLVIRPDLTGIDYLDFQKKTEVAFRGKNAVMRNLEELKKLAGMTKKLVLE